MSFAYPGNAITREALPILKDLGIKFARRGGAPEYAYENGRGFAYEPGVDHPLLIPSAGDARPDWTLEDFKRAVDQAHDGRIFETLTGRGGILVAITSEARAADALAILHSYGGGNAAIGAWAGRL